ncbi:hypothetical protein FHS20_003932 [Phyllobacterium endophyticum]|nr:hypothetical protein [Phyllobacterium endophyticum]
MRMLSIAMLTMVNVEYKAEAFAAAVWRSPLT